MAAALGATVVGLAAVGRAGGPFAVVSAAGAVGVLLWGLLRLPHSRRLIGPPTAVAGAVSLVATALSPRHLTPQAGGAWKLLEIGILLVLLAAAVRWAPRRQAVAAVATAGAAGALWTLPYLDGGLVMRVGAFLSWLFIVAIAAGLGGYPRWTAQRQREAVAAARREQQLALARDLHDFVAHDISGIVVQAQAARFVAAANPAQALAALERIEAAGLHALAAMDRTVQMLHEPEEQPAPNGPLGAGRSAPRAPLAGVAQLAELVERFTAAGATVARLSLDPGVAEALPRETGATAYRVVVEALTNVRRHAPAAEQVEVELRGVSGAAVRVRVVNGAGPGPGLGHRERGRGGRGLRELGEMVRASGGVFSAGPCEQGWQVVAELRGHHD